MASYIDPQCGMPVFAQDSEDVASQCGMYNGYIIAFILSVLDIVITLSMYYKSEDEKTKKKNNKIIYIGLGILVLIWLLPFLLGFFAKRNWQSYDLQIKGYMAKGMTKPQAIEQIQSAWATREQASAIQGAGANIGSSILMSDMFRK